MTRRQRDMVRQVLAFDEENPTPVHRLAYACAEDPAHARAASFQSGVLWRMAELNLLSRVDVFLVKMRYPSHDTPCQPLISPDEVRRGESSYEVTQILNPETYKVPDAPQRSINGLCCDCCHGCCAKGPCGRFPFLGVGNQFLTPLQYANLARLGHELAAEPLAQLVEARAAAMRRKSSPAAALIGWKRMEECADCPLLSSRF